MGNLLGKEKPLKEVLRENKRMITRAIRELDREKMQLEKEEKRLTIEIKKAAKEQQMTSVKIMAKDLVRTRQYITKFIEMRSHLQGCSLKLQTVKSHHAMAEAMKSTAKAMHKMNKAVDVPAINKMMADFEKENAKTEIMQEIMGDTIDDALGDENNEEEEEQIVNQVLDEIGISFGEELPQASAMGTPGQMEASPGKVAVVEADDPALSELEARLNNLKR
ncbi:Snf7 family protein [Nitzschia inconspicua]|uniref:Snf7 family protein n=1 Tax=Nitzschia inconspicua TaxID=303405 RepID=A0A9K3K7F2_9STRA|nr:Snf7 family protein [Nitzschia inconspicua]KAG7340469.1 Snf7 family protein [Nitzschia inconspicua]KAG7373129.1 Snf7 family protein [Nitzschia inconspicua]